MYCKKKWFWKLIYVECSSIHKWCRHKDKIQYKKWLLAHVSDGLQHNGNFISWKVIIMLWVGVYDIVNDLLIVL
jgi:hypothetical protein